MNALLALVGWLFMVGAAMFPHMALAWLIASAITFGAYVWPALRNASRPSP